MPPPRSARRVLPAGRSLGRGGPWLLAGAFFALYATVSVGLHHRLETTAYDLGIFEQAVRAYAAGDAPVSTLRGLNLLGDHFSPIMALMAPAYLLVPRPQTLLVVQAALLAASVVPVTRLATRWFGGGTALLVGLAYGSSWGLQRAVGFDVHEIAFAVPMLAFTLESLALQRWGRAVLWALPLVLVKEDLPLTLAAVGIYVALSGRRRLGLAVTGFALAAGALAVLVVLPAVNPADRYEYLGALPGAGSAGAGSVLAGLEVKATTLLWLLAPTALLALRSPLLLLALPTLAWRFTAGNPNYWGTGFHYSAVLMPVVFVAFLDGMRRVEAGGGAGRWVRRPALAVTAAGTAFLAPSLPLHQLTDRDFLRTDARVEAAHDLMDRIPDGARVAAGNGLAPQLTARAEVYLFPLRPGVPEPEWVVVDLATPSWPKPLDEVRREVAALRDAGYRTVATGHGIVLLHRPPGVTPGEERVLVPRSDAATGAAAGY